MKETGIIRRIDELGRIVIPKDIRKNLGIGEDAPMEISIEGSTIALKKYDSNQMAKDKIEELFCWLSNDEFWAEDFMRSAVMELVRGVRNMLEEG